MSHIMSPHLLDFFFFLMIRRPPRSTRTDTLFPYTTLFRSNGSKPVLLFVDMRKVLLRRHSAQRSVRPVGPGMIGAAEGERIAPLLTDQRHAPVRTGVVERPHIPVLAARNDHIGIQCRQITEDRKSTRLNSSH